MTDDPFRILLERFDRFDSRLDGVEKRLDLRYHQAAVAIPLTC